MRRQGRITRVNIGNHYGFLRGAGDTRDAFFHGRDSSTALFDYTEGDLVTFEDDEPGERGPRAKAVMLVAVDDEFGGNR